MRALNVRFDVAGGPATAIVAQDDSVWIALQPRWWDLATWLWWWLCPSDRKARVKLKMDDHTERSVRAVRIANKYVRVRGMPKL